MERVVVLVVSDADLRQGVNHTLTRHGFDVASFCHERQALQFVIVHGARVSGLVAESSSDLNHRFRICQCLRERNARAPIVVLAADHRMLEEATRAGFYAFMSDGPLFLLTDVLRGSAHLE